MRFSIHYAYNGNPKYRDSKDNREYYDSYDICKLLNRLSRAEEIIDEKLKELETDYDQGAKLGLPTGALIGEINLLEEIKEELKNNGDEKCMENQKEI